MDLQGDEAVSVNRVLSCDSCRDLICPSLSFYLLIKHPTLLVLLISHEL